MPAARPGRAATWLRWVSGSTDHEGKEGDDEDDDDDQAVAVRSAAIDAPPATYP
jgi:hypothetical protein